MRFLLTQNPAGPYLDPAHHRVALTILSPNAKAAGHAVHDADSEEALAATLQLTRVTPAPVITRIRVWPPLAFFLRFTDLERHAIYTAARTTPEIQDFVTLGSASVEIHSDNPLVLSALQAFVQARILAPTRPAEILAGS